jgi:hypothetical protein
MKAREATESRQADALSLRLEELSGRARRLADVAEASNNTRDSLLALREMSRLIEIEARIAGRIEGTKVEVNLNNIKIDLLTDEQIENFFQRLGKDRRIRIVGRQINEAVGQEAGSRAIDAALSRAVGRPVTLADAVAALRGMPGVIEEGKNEE